MQRDARGQERCARCSDGVEGAGAATHGASAALLALVLAVVVVACDGPTVDNPYSSTAAAGGAGGAANGGGGAGGDDPWLGGPCTDDAQCDDGLACTSESCDPSIARCRYVPDDTPCDDGVYCNGLERCDRVLGCALGDPIDCGDGDPCTIEACDEVSQACRSAPRDADEDGDPDVHCGGGDCDDGDPRVASTELETCANLLDDDCDGVVDEPMCEAPTNDDCLDPRVVDADATFSMSTKGATSNYATSCAPMGVLRDVVAAVVVPAGPPRDVVVRATTDTVPVSLALAGQCGDAASELACSPTYQRNGVAGNLAKIRARGVGGGAQATPFPLYVTTAGVADIGLQVAFEPATVAPANETCGTADDLAPGVPTELELVDAATDLDTACARALGELVYRIELAEPADVDLWATSLDGDGRPTISLRDSDCALSEDELACHSGAVAHVYRRALAAGTYYVAATSTAPTRLSLLAELSPPTVPPADDDCAAPPTLANGVAVDVAFDDRQDDVALGCFTQAVDVVYALELAQKSDVLLVDRLSFGDSGSVQLVAPACDTVGLLGCAFGAQGPLRVRELAAPAGSYRVVVESALGLPQQVSAFARPHAPPKLVLFADACADALAIPATGGLFKGNTSNLGADFTAGCDQSGSGPGGAPDQLLRLELAAPSRVVLDATGSSLATTISVRKGPSCPGAEVPLGCSAAIAGRPSFLDLQLAAGTYFVQVDGLGGASGAWTLDVHVAPQ